MALNNRVLQAIQEGRMANGYHLTFPSPHVVEILAPLNFDFVWIDGEHGPFSLENLEELCRVSELVGITPIARVPNIELSTILQYLDRGIQGIIGPHISTKADARQLVNACYFGPEGQRSFGGNRGCHYNWGLEDKKAFYAKCNQNMLVVALLEDSDVAENLGEILTVDGIDYFAIGPNDFAQGIGYPGEAEHPDVIAAMEEIHSRIRAAGKTVRGDVVRSRWVKEFLTDSASRFLAES
jgi:4-hydroxy-2-oxoheptanedioate aldolase